MPLLHSVGPCSLGLGLGLRLVVLGNLAVGVSRVEVTLVGLAGLGLQIRGRVGKVRLTCLGIQGFTLKRHSYFFNLRSNGRGAFIKIVGESWSGDNPKTNKGRRGEKRQLFIPECAWSKFGDALNSSIGIVRSQRIDFITGELQRLIDVNTM